jgi:hypothetical protein
MTKQLVLSKDWGLRTLKWRAFVRDHRQWLTFVGALIVFLTFVSKEVLREHWTGLATSVEGTENILNVRNDLDTVYVELRSVARQNLEIYNMVSEERQDAYMARSHMSEEKKKFLRDAQVGYSSLQDFDVIVTGVVSGQKRLEMLRGLVAQLPDHADRENSREALVEAARKFVRTPHDYPPGDLETLKKQIDRFVDSTLSEAREKLEHWRVLSERFGWISIILYSLGWSLGFVGKVYGLQTEAEE